MKRLLIKTLAIGLILLAMPMTHLAQQPKFVHNESTIDFDITRITVFDQRIVFLYNLINDSRFNVVNSERDGVFIISADHSYADLNLVETFADFQKQNARLFSSMDKEALAELAVEYKALLPIDQVNSLMMDYYTRSRQNNHCADAEPFCTDNGLYQFPAGVNAGSGENGPYYDCLHSTPNPAWYYMRIANPGGMTINMYSTPSRDIDFCCWGPYDNIETQSPCPNGLTSSKVVSCSYSTSAVENCIIPNNAQTGQYYILIITNYSNNSCNISFSKTAGNGTTDCSIMPPLVSNDGPYCAGQTIQLHANGQTGASYSWVGPGGFTSTLQNPTRPNCTLAMAGNYSCFIQVGSQSSGSVDTQVEVYANPMANAGEDQTIAYPGATAQLHGTGGAGSFNYHWEPANKIAQQGQNAITQPLYEDTQFTLTVSNPQANCEDTDQMTVHIGGSAMTASASASNYDICNGESTQLQVSAGGGSGNFSYSWSPSGSLNHSNIYNPVATPTQTTTYTCHVTDVSAQTSQDVSVTIHVHNASTSQMTQYICEGSSYNFFGNLCSEEGDYEYHSQTTYGCDSTIILHLHHHPSYVDYEDGLVTHATICPGDSYMFHGQPYSEEGHFPHTLETVHHCDSVVWLDLHFYPEHEITDYDYTTCEADLPYHFHGVSFYHAIDTIFTLDDVHGCDSLVYLHLHIDQYTVIPTEKHYLCYDGDTPPPYVWSANGQTYYGEDITAVDTLSYGNCEAIFNLKVYQRPTPETVVVDTTVCDNFEWIVEGDLVDSYQSSGTYHHSKPFYLVEGDPNTRFDCDREFLLHLTVNKSGHDSGHISGCDSVPFVWFGNTLWYKEDGIVELQGFTTHGCDSTYTLTVKDMMYTPNPQIICADNGIAYPHHPITSTEFIISQYTYSAVDPQSDQTWLNSQCRWAISKESWPIEPSSDNHSCIVYALDWVPDTVYLYFTAFNPCDLEGVTTRYYLKPSFYGVHEQEAYPAAVEIFPNPNDGNMRLRFENMEGHLDIKVFSSTGLLTDSFEVTTSQVGEDYNYSMKRLSNGIYFFVITDGKRSVTKKVVIIN